MRRTVPPGIDRLGFGGNKLGQGSVSESNMRLYLEGIRLFLPSFFLTSSFDLLFCFFLTLPSLLAVPLISIINMESSQTRPQSPPDFSVPASSSTVDVRVINT